MTVNFVFLFINVIIDNAALTWSSVLIRQTVSRSEIPKVRYIGIFELYISPIPVSEHIPVYRICPVYRFSRFVSLWLHYRQWQRQLVITSCWRKKEAVWFLNLYIPLFSRYISRPFLFIYHEGLGMFLPWLTMATLCVHNLAPWIC